MFWVYLVVSVGLVGFLIEMWLDYKKKAGQLKAGQEKVRQSIAMHQAATAEAQREAEKSRFRVEELKQEKAALSHDINWDKETLKELEEKAQRRSLTRHPLTEDE
jgi:hypothetical protein